jgi:predicted ester cyclase
MLANTAKKNREVVERFLNHTHSNDLADLAVIDETVAENIVCHGFPGEPICDREAYKNFFRNFRQSFDNMDWTIHALVADSTYVSARWEIEATHCGPFAGVEASGQRVRFNGMVLYRMERGRIAETWLQINELMLLQAIGALPAQAA